MLALALQALFGPIKRAPINRWTAIGHLETREVRRSTVKKLLEGKTAVITGAGSGMGLSAAKLFHAEGASLVLADISGNEQKVAAELGGRTVGITADVSRPADAKAMIDLAVSKFGGLDILCNVAGVDGSLLPLVESTEENFEKMIAVNLRGVFLTMRNAIPHMIKRGGGSIVNIASTAAIIGTPNLAAYAASKAGVVALTKSAAVEYAKVGIRVNAICPGIINTPMMQSAAAANPGATEYFARLVPMGRIGEAGEIANPMLFLASEQSSYMTGAVLPVEGGQTTA
jgi:NAD(P)-dependent dehydrogenase (short-subunit alcohol dehydrogenase family)